MTFIQSILGLGPRFINKKKLEKKIINPNLQTKQVIKSNISLNKNRFQRNNIIAATMCHANEGYH